MSLALAFSAGLLATTLCSFLLWVHRDRRLGLPVALLGSWTLAQGLALRRLADARIADARIADARGLTDLGGGEDWLALGVGALALLGVLQLRRTLRERRPADAGPTPAAQEQFWRGQRLEALGRLAGSIAHDFNNLLTTIIGNAEMAQVAASSGRRVSHSLVEIREAGVRGARLVRQLLSAGRRDAAQPQAVDLNRLTLGLDPLLRRLVGEDVELVTLPTDEPLAVFADSVQVEQVLLNLAANARDAMPSGGVLSISLQAAPRDGTPGVQVSVEDSGEGMTEEVIERAFEPFFTTKQAAGTGLGLAICRGIVRSSGGEIGIRSRPGQGTIVTLWLPQTDLPIPTGQEPSRPWMPGGNETILVVEDEAAVRRVAASTLSEAGYTVLEASNGADALRLAETHATEIDLILTDLVMPHLGGAELAERLLRTRPELSFLYMSGYSDSRVWSAGESESSPPLLPKPFTRSELLHQVRQSLDGQATRRANFASA